MVVLWCRIPCPLSLETRLTLQVYTVAVQYPSPLNYCGEFFRNFLLSQPLLPEITHQHVTSTRVEPLFYGRLVGKIFLVTKGIWSFNRTLNVIGIPGVHHHWLFWPQKGGDRQWSEVNRGFTVCLKWFGTNFRDNWTLYHEYDWKTRNN